MLDDILDFLGVNTYETAIRCGETDVFSRSLLRLSDLLVGVSLTIIGLIFLTSFVIMMKNHVKFSELRIYVARALDPGLGVLMAFMLTGLGLSNIFRFWTVIGCSQHELVSIRVFTAFVATASALWLIRSVSREHQKWRGLN